MLKCYVHGPAAGQDDPLVEYNGSSVASPRHLMADHQGSIIAIADINGNRIAMNGFDEYGIPNGLTSRAVIGGASGYRELRLGAPDKSRTCGRKLKQWKWRGV